MREGCPLLQIWAVEVVWICWFSAARCRAQICGRGSLRGQQGRSGLGLDLLWRWFATAGAGCLLLLSCRSWLLVANGGGRPDEGRGCCWWISGLDHRGSAELRLVEGGDPGGGAAKGERLGVLLELLMPLLDCSRPRLLVLAGHG